MYWDQHQVDPKCQNGAQMGAEKQEKQHRAAQRAYQDKESQLALLRHNEEKQGENGTDAYECVQHCLPDPSAQRAEGAGDIVDQSQRAAQQNRAEKLGQLERDLVAH